MHPEDDAPLTLSKWPFYLGDALLVATALAIAILGDWQLSDWQVASCVIAVALGAGLFVLPFIVEYYMRGQERSEDHSAELRILVRRIERLEGGFESFDEQLEVLASDRLADSKSADSLMEAVDGKLNRLDALPAELKDLEKRHTAQFEELKAELKGLDSGPDLSALQQRLDSLEEALNAKVEAEKPHPVPKRQPRKRRKAEAPLIHRAIKAEEANGSAAVKRIIQAAPHTKEKVETDEAEPEVEEEAVSEPISVESENPEIITEEVERESVSAIEAEPEPDVTVEIEKGETILEAEAPVTETQDDSMDLDAEVPLINTADMLFDDVPVKPKKARSRVKKADTILTVKALIGIGNRPYLRGSGGGLSWDKGVEMDFQEIGKWRWVAPAPLDEAIEVEIYRNDEDPDQAGRHRIEPGQKMEISPEFS